MFKKKLLALVLACTTVFSMVGCSPKEAKEEKKVLRVGVAAQHKPWCYKDGEDIVGIDVDILKEAAKRMGDYEVEFELASFDGMFGLLDAGKVDTVAQQISITPERKEKYKFSEVYAYNPYKLVVGKDDNSINSMEDLKGKKIIAQPATSDCEFIETYKKEHDPNNEINLIITEESGALSISQGKVDAATFPVLIFDDFVKESGLNVKLTGDPISEDENAFPFLKEGNDEMYNKFNEALKSMKEDGFMTDLYNKYFGIDISKPSAK